MFKKLILFMWCLPQNIIGLFVLLFTRLQGAKSTFYKGTIITRWNYSKGLSMGCFIFVSKYAGDKTIKHEYGHFLDGNCLGPLYLPIIGIPSFCWAAFFAGYRAKNKVSYYSFYTERRADTLGEVDR